MSERVPLVRRAIPDDSTWIVGLSERVQAALTASGSLQEIGPLALPMVELSIQEDHTYVLQVDQDRVGSVLVDPLDGINPNTLTIEYNDWALEKLPRPLWYLHGLMIEPAEQRNGMGLIFLEGVLQLMKVEGGTIVLDCWEGNIKLRAFYQKAGFSQKGTFPESDYKIAVYYRSNLAV